MGIRDRLLGMKDRLFDKYFFLVVFVIFLLQSVVSAQNPHGSLRGIVEDSTGARVSGAGIVLKGAESGFERNTRSDAQGAFRVEDLPAGSYTLAVNAGSFAEASTKLTVAISTVTEVNVRMRPASVEQTLRVEGQRASSITTQPVNTQSAVQQAVITASDLQNLPLAARSFANIAYLAPGTEPVEPSDPTKARITAVSTGGSSGLNNEISVDGGDNSDDYIGGFLQNFSADAIQEFAFRTSNEEADTGRTVGGSVVITTKHGTNVWHGSGAFYERASALNARFPIDNPPPQPKQPFSRQNYVATLGGPLRRDKFWVFGSFEAVHEDASINYSASSLTEFNALAS